MATQSIMSKVVFITIILLFSSVYAHGQSTETADYLSVALVPNGKLIMPIAEYKNKMWGRVEDMSVFASEPLNQWHLYYPSGTQEEIRAGQIIIEDESYYDAFAGLETSFEPESRRYGSPPQAHLAFTEQVKLVRFLPADTVVFESLIEEITDLLEKAEADIISTGEGYRHEKEGIAYLQGIPVEDSIRASITPLVELMIADNQLQDKQLMYFNVAKRYPCRYPTLRGWIVQKENEYKYVTLPGEELFYMDECENKSGVYYQFHGAFEWDERVWVVTDISAWAAIDYELIELQEDNLRFLIKDFYGDWVNKISSTLK